VQITEYEQKSNFCVVELLLIVSMPSLIIGAKLVIIF